MKLFNKQYYTKEELTEMLRESIEDLDVEKLNAVKKQIEKQKDYIVQPDVKEPENW